jgi:hypothetical protein
MIHWYLGYSLLFAVGMDLRNFGCTQMKHSRSWRTSLPLLGENFMHLVSIPALLSRRRRRQQRSMATSKATVSRQSKTFNLQTYKLHALGDYVSSIRRFGTTDSYSTQPVRDSTLVGVAFLPFAHRENESTALGKGGSFGPVARISFISSLKLKGGSYAYTIFARGWMLHTKLCWNLFPVTRRNTIRSEDRKICLSISQFFLDRILTTQLSG